MSRLPQWGHTSELILRRVLTVSTSERTLGRYSGASSGMIMAASKLSEVGMSDTLSPVRTSIKGITPIAG
ncbi:hypothetical protein D3C72_2022480 [compost metagenome]